MAKTSNFAFLILSFSLLPLLAACAPDSQADASGTSRGAYENQALPADLDPTIAGMVNAALIRANEIRRENNLPELSLDLAITHAAQGHAADMLTRNYFEHASLDGRSPFDRMRNSGASFRAAAENIAHGQRSAEQVFRSWLNSPGHRQNLLNPRYRRQGIGWANGYWVHDFAD